MLSIEEINKAILELENHDTTFATCEKLAYLYIVKDHFLEKKNDASAPTYSNFGDSEFLKAINGDNIYGALKILDEHMEVVKVLIPREYASLIEKIKGLTN